MLFEIGRVCKKLAGRDAGKFCVVVDIVDDTYVLIDGQTRRRKCNVLHLEPTEKVVTLKKGASTAVVVSALSKLDIFVKEKKKSKKSSPRPKHVRSKKSQPSDK